MQLAVILSTYNGAPYIRAQLDSILQQDTPIDRIVIRDDGSTDNTLAIIQEYQHHHPAIVLLEDTLGNVGVLRSYSLLLRHVATLAVDYCMFADQDDVWFADKTTHLLAGINDMDNTKPALAFSDVQLVDADLNLIAPSLIAYQKLLPKKKLGLKELFFYCPALGCAMIFNRHLLSALLALWDNFPNPDKWAILVAASIGDVKYIATPTLFYRQHNNNVTGAVNKGIYRKNLTFTNWQFIQQRYQTALNEARILESHLVVLPPQHAQLIKHFKDLFTARRTIRIKQYLRFCLTPPHWKRKAGLFLSLFQKYQ